jgi:hypothetical protein
MSGRKILETPRLTLREAALSDRSFVHAALEEAYNERRGGLVFMRTAPETGLHSFLTAISRLGPSHRVPSIARRQALTRVQTFVVQLQVLGNQTTFESRSALGRFAVRRRMTRVGLFC